MGKPLLVKRRIVLVLVALAIVFGGGLAIGTAVRARPTLVVVQRGPTYPATAPASSSSHAPFNSCRGFDQPVVGQSDRCQPVVVEHAEAGQPQDGAPGIPVLTGGTAPPMRGRERLLALGGATALALGLGLLGAISTRPTRRHDVGSP